jgi:hypothetical protein
LVYLNQLIHLVKEHLVAKTRRQNTRPGANVFSSDFSATGLFGGAKEDRTPDLLRAKQALSQLSYGPFGTRELIQHARTLFFNMILVGLGGLEPPTSPLSGVRSNHLSYRPNPHRAC